MSETNCDNSNVIMKYDAELNGNRNFWEVENPIWTFADAEENPNWINATQVETSIIDNSKFFV